MKKLLLLPLLLGAAAVSAEEPVKHWSGESELGYVWKNGNTKSETFNAKQKVVYEAKPWLNTFVAEASNTSNSEKNANNKTEKKRVGERYFLSDQVDYFVSERTYTFGRAAWEKDKFNGFDYRASWVVGVGHAFLDSGTFSLKGEAGVGEAIDVISENRDKAIERDKRRDTMGYLSEEMVWKFSSNAELGQSIRSEYTRYNTYSRFDVYVKAMLVGNLAMKAAYTLRYNNKVPVGTFNRDEEASLSLAYSF